MQKPPMTHFPPQVRLQSARMKMIQLQNCPELKTNTVPMRNPRFKLILITVEFFVWHRPHGPILINHIWTDSKHVGFTRLRKRLHNCNISPERNYIKVTIQCITAPLHNITSDDTV